MFSSRIGERLHPMGDATAALPSGTVTFLLTDVVGSTPLWERDAERMAASLAVHRRILQDAIARHHGVHPLEQGEGDSMVVAFERASDALTTALEAQLALAAADWSGGPALEVRMAMHSGNATAQPDRTYHGATIIRCARLRSIAVGGQVLLSSSTAGLLADALPAGCRLDEAGLFHLKGLRRPETVFQLHHPGLPATLPPLPDTARSNLQPALTSFVGRRGELAELDRLLPAHRSITLTGAGGCGKTRLALELAARRVDEYVGGAWWVDLAPVGSESEALVAIARALSISEELGRPIIDTLLDHLGRASGLLLVLDNAEHLLEPLSQFLARALPASPGLAVLVTSREPLGIPGEVTVRVPSLDVDDDAIVLFVDRVAAARPGLRVDEAARDVIARICRRLDGLPLAIELAAARVRTMPLERVASGLDDAFRLLAGGPRTAVRRQQTMQACLDWSVDQLDETEKVVLRRLATFVGSFTLEAAEGVAGGDGVEPWVVFDAVDRMVDKSLVQLDTDTGRYRLLELLRQHGVEALRVRGELAAARTRHARWFCTWTQERTRLGVLEDDPWPEIAADHLNVMTAVDYLMGEDPTVALHTLARLGIGYFDGAERNTEGAQRFADVASIDPALAPLPWARAVASLAIEAAWGGTMQTDTVERARSIAIESGDSYTELLTDFVQTIPLSFVGGLEAVADIAARAEAEGVLMVDVLAHLQLAAVQNLLGREAEALRVCSTMLDRLGRRVFRWANLFAAHRAFATGTLGRLEEAIALAASVETINQSGAVIIASLYCRAGLRLNEPRLIQHARMLLPRSEWGFIGAMVQQVTYAEAVMARRWDEALELLEAAQALHFLPSSQIEARELVIPTLLALSRPADAMAATGALAAFAEALGSDRGRSVAVLGRAAAALMARSSDSRDHVVEALRDASTQHYLLAKVEVLELLAAQLAREERLVDALRFRAAAGHARDALGYRWRWPHVVALGEEVDRLAEAGLDDVSRAQAEAEGAALTLEDAVTLALRGHGTRKRPSFGWDSLTPTEHDVVRLVAEGRSNEEIAAKLVVGIATVRTHLNHVYAKLGLPNRAALAAEAVRRSEVRSIRDSRSD